MSFIIRRWAASTYIYVMLSNQCMSSFSGMIDAEKEADKRALDQVAKLFQRPDQLEKLDALRKKADGKRVRVFCYYLICIRSLCLLGSCWSDAANGCSLAIGGHTRCSRPSKPCEQRHFDYWKGVSEVNKQQRFSNALQHEQRDDATTNSDRAARAHEQSERGESGAQSICSRHE